jgi:hypothetical protein
VPVTVNGDVLGSEANRSRTAPVDLALNRKLQFQKKGWCAWAWALTNDTSSHAFGLQSRWAEKRMTDDQPQHEKDRYDQLADDLAYSFAKMMLEVLIAVRGDPRSAERSLDVTEFRDAIAAALREIAKERRHQTWTRGHHHQISKSSKRFIAATTIVS